MKKTTAGLLLASGFLTLLLSISYTKAWLNTINIPTDTHCLFSPETQKDPKTRRVCLNGGCILYSNWIKMSDEEREVAIRG